MSLKRIILSLYRISFTILRVSVCLLYRNQRVLIEWELLAMRNSSVIFSSYFDFYSSLFMASVSIIAATVFTFSQSYMAHEKYFLRFHILVVIFVISIALLIFCPNLVTLLIGWDGLGVTSYLLVIYFQNTKAYGAGMITALTNRVGDVLILISIALFLNKRSFRFWFWSLEAVWVSPIWILLIAAITKSAQIPFSAWLPAAIAAPTPVSSLVHSSTLVTAGVYLVFRLRGGSDLTFALFILGVSTIIIASLSAMWEIDIKKIVALSTLSQLGLIFRAMGLGLFKVAFFHLLTHAYFKALLFISVGNSIHLSNDYQDLRKVGLCPWSLSSTTTFALIANFSLCGLPFMGGFYSKDLILESILMRNYSVWAWGLFFFSVALTVLYSLRFTFITLWKASSSEKLSFREDSDRTIKKAILGLFPLAVIGGAILGYLLFNEPISVVLPLEQKNLALSFILAGRLASYTSSNIIVNNKHEAWRLGRIWSLPFVSGKLLVINFIRLGGLARKSDLSWLPKLILTGVPSFKLRPIDASPIEFNSAFMIKTVGLFFLLSLIIYLCVIKLIIISKIKT